MHNPFSNFPQNPAFAMNYPQGYQGYPRPQFSAQKIGVIRVNGRAGVDALQMAPNDQALLLDETAPIVWFVQTDGAGYKTPIPYKVAPYKQEPPVDASALEARVTKLEEMLNGKPNLTGNGAIGSDDTNAATTA